MKKKKLLAKLALYVDQHPNKSFIALFTLVALIILLMWLVF